MGLWYEFNGFNGAMCGVAREEEKEGGRKERGRGEESTGDSREHTGTLLGSVGEQV